jgi:hypothetical protein
MVGRKRIHHIRFYAGQTVGTAVQASGHAGAREAAIRVGDCQRQLALACHDPA